MHRATRPIRTYTIGELAEASGVSPRTIRFYTNQRILPHAHGRGPTAFYDDRHLYGLRIIREARDQRTTLDDLRERIQTAYPSAFAKAPR